jgi:hypothetical protein
MSVKIFTFLINIPLGILLLLLATIGFDVLHVCLHQFAQSSNTILKKIGALHTTHHQFLDTDLRIHESLMASNVFRHVIPEFIVQVAVTLALMPVFPIEAVVVAFIIELAVFIFIMWGKPGFDVNHKYISQLKAYRPMYFCVPEYHLLHHVNPTAYFSSWIKTLDHLSGTGTALFGRRVVLAGAGTDFAETLAYELNRAGAHVNWLDVKTSPQSDSAAAAFQHADILVLCHKPATGWDYRNIIEQFSQLHRHRRIPVEVWALVSNNEFADPVLSIYAQYAKQLFARGDIIYRHLIADGDNCDSQAAKSLLKRIRRGFNYVPARYTAALLKHYWQFVLK